MKVLTATQSRQLDAYTIKAEGIESIDLMERAAQALTAEIRRLWSGLLNFYVFAGSGNNGGDALAVARLLAAEGHRVEVFLFNVNGKLSKDCETNRDRLVEGAASSRVVFHEITKNFEMPELSESDIVIDGLFGSGLNKPINGGLAALVKLINRSAAKVVSIDLPSGLMCEDNSYNIPAHIIRADVTLTIQTLKPSFLMADNQEYLGEVRVVNIGLKEDEITFTENPYTLDELSEMASLLRGRSPFGNKGTFGHGLLIAGSYGMAGAAVLAARACMKSGIGKLTIHTPKVNNSILQISVPEVVLHHDEDNYFFSTPVKMEPYNAVAIGPGLGTKNCSAVAFAEQMSHTTVPLILDADALNILGGHRGWLQQIPSNAILTPHPKEFMRLFGECLTNFDQLHQAREQAIHQQIYIILKGHYTAICTPQGHTYFNSTGNSGMATAGTGDALTGILLSLLSQGYSIENACRLGVYIHGLAGDLAAEELTEEGTTVNDLIDYIPYAIKKLKRHASSNC